MSTTVRHQFTGQPVQFTVPPGVTGIDVDATGASGAGLLTIGRDYGRAARVRALLAVTPGEVLWLYVGGLGDGQQGWNGGGRSGTSQEYGGGATDIRRGGQGLQHRILVAGGGGASALSGRAGGDAGLNGAAGESGQLNITSYNGAGELVTSAPNAGGAGGTQTQGGVSGGTLGRGGGAGGVGAGGGGGYYGGGAGGGDDRGDGAGGGGGSSLLTVGAYLDTPLAGDASLVLSFDRPPDPPDRLSPPAGSALARNDRNRLSWRHVDPDGEAQTAYQLELQAPGAAGWTPLQPVQTPNSWHDLEPGQAAGPWRWRVRTASSSGTGQPSAAGEFTLGDRAPGPTWLDPINGQTVPTRVYRLRWSGTGVQYRIRSVRDAGGVRDDSVVYASTAAAPVGTRTHDWTFPVNGRTEWLLIEEADANGLWSSIGAARVTVSYTLPARPVVELTPDLERLAIAVRISTPTPTSSQPVTARHTVRIRPVGDTGPGQLVTDSAGRNALVRYRFPAVGVDYEVLVGSVGENGAVDEGAWTSRTVTTSTGPARYDTARFDAATYG